MELYNLKIFSWVEKNIIDNILNNSPTEHYSPGEIVVSQGDESNWKWYIIKSWEVEVIINSKQIAKLWVWEIFWEIALLNEEERTATVKVISDLELIVITLENLIDIVNNWNTSVNEWVMERIEQNLKSTKITLN